MTIRKRLAAAVAIAASLLTLAVAPQASAADSPIPGIRLTPYTGPAADPAHPAYHLVSGWTGGCLGPRDDIGRNGAPMWVGTCGNTAVEAFYVTRNPEGYYRFQNIVTQRYLEAATTTAGANGTAVQLWDFVAGGQNQWWTATVNPEGYLRLKNAKYGRYLEASRTVTGPYGNKAQLWDYVAGGTNQWWH
jgi:hypothetical protein